MARFDVYANPDGGYLLDVQADLLDALNTRVVVPLIPLGAAPTPAKGLNPVFEIRSGPHVMATQFLSAVPCSILGEPVANFLRSDTEITNALDMLLTGI
ncbi:CcdB family protein [Nisaea acidiphila]|uniref:Toxin CcdB n=1 Tax=Nisaea acidiphila TaxID=1862145 RepID=A0A9J7ARJ7_9PROT|nr:CcdB family protein [Nisaea acidiphila]UUX49871.1 CcdB family protein [Nisaea acidiphila]